MIMVALLTTTTGRFYFINVDEYSILFGQRLDYGDVDNSIDTFVSNSYFHIDAAHLLAPFDSQITLDILILTSLHHYYGWAEYIKTDTFTSIIPETSSSSVPPLHGDWVLKPS